MKNSMKTLGVAALGAVLALGGHQLLQDQPQSIADYPAQVIEAPAVSIPVSNTLGAAAVNGVDFRAASKKTVDAVVHVSNTQIRNVRVWGSVTQQRSEGTGSGVIISPDGYIVTNNHVIEGSSKLTVKLNDNQIYDAKLIGTDPSSDIALLKVEADKDLPYIPFGDSDTIEVGEWVLAVGNPFNLTSTVTAGIVSAKGRDLDERDGKNQSFIQTDAAVNPGNSGGALVNTNGELVGINTLIHTRTGSFVGYSFAVPSNNARKIIEDIMQFGSVQRGMLGIIGSNLNSKAAKQLGINSSNGVLVSGTTEDAHPSIAALRQGDVITGIDNLEVGKFSDLTGYVDSKSPGDAVTLQILRDGRSTKLPITISKKNSVVIRDLGLEVRNPTSEEKEAYGVEKGVYIMRAVGGMSSRSNALSGFIIYSINDEIIEDIEDLEQSVSNLTGRRMSIRMIDREGNMERFVFDR